MTLANHAMVSSQSTGTGNAGNIRMTAHKIFDGQNSAVTTGASQSVGGNIEIIANTLKLRNTPVTASVKEGVGRGGNVTLTAPSIVALDNSDITARANQGFGGNITINANVFLRDFDVRLDASSQVFGNDGTVEINAPDLDLSAALVTLPASYLNAAAQLSQRCAAVEMDTRSSFVVRGRDVLPPGPDEALPARMAGCLSDKMTEPATKVPLALSSDTPDLSDDRWENSR
jgi:large exoprotein involved in heme utilization and adhesion